MAEIECRYSRGILALPLELYLPRHRLWEVVERFLSRNMKIEIFLGIGRGEGAQNCLISFACFRRVLVGLLWGFDHYSKNFMGVS